MGKDYNSIPTLTGEIYPASKEWCKKIKGDFRDVCANNPSHTDTLYQYFLDANRSDLITPKLWYQRAFGDKSDSRAFENLVRTFERSDKLIVKDYVMNNSLKKIKKEIEKEIATNLPLNPEQKQETELEIQ